MAISMSIFHTAIINGNFNINVMRVLISMTEYGSLQKRPVTEGPIMQGKTTKFQQEINKTG